jgi:hypothetical protein
MHWFEAVVNVIVGLISGFATRNIAFAFAFAILFSGLGIYAVFVLRPHLKFMLAVRGGTRNILSASAKGQWTAEDRLAAIDKGIKGNPVLGAAWRAYRTGLRPNPKLPGEFVNPVDPHGWFALGRLPGRGYEKWAATMAGVSLTVGLLFTFVGLTAALFRVGEAGSDTAQLRLAIAAILQISSAKFITSMAGIVAFIGWTLAARAHASAQAKAAIAFAAAVQALTSPVSPEALLLDLLENARDGASRLKTLSDDMAVAFDSSLGRRLDALPAAVGKILQPALESSVRPVVDAIQGMGSSIGSGNHAALEGMIAGLVDGVQNATGREMGLLVDAMREAAGELMKAKSGIGAGGAEFEGSLARAAEGMTASSARMAEAMERRTGEIDARMQRIDDALSAGASRFDTMGAAMTGQVTDGLRMAMETIAAAAQAGADVARGQAQAGLAPVLGELSKLIGEIRNSAEESRSALVAGGKSAAQDLGSALSKAGDELSSASGTASGILVRSFEDATARMVTAVESAAGGYRTATDALASRISAVEQGFAGLDQSMRRSVGQLDAAGGAIIAAGRTFGDASDQMQKAAAPVLATLAGVEAAASASRDALRHVRDTSSAMQAAATATTASSEAAATAFRSYEQRFASVDAGLGQTIARLRDGVVELGSKVTEVVSHYDEHLGRAVGLLRGGVEEMAAAVESLGDKLQEPALGGAG